MQLPYRIIKETGLRENNTNDSVWADLWTDEF
jgi:hypothetical protein